MGVRPRGRTKNRVEGGKEVRGDTKPKARQHLARRRGECKGWHDPTENKMGACALLRVYPVSG